MASTAKLFIFLISIFICISHTTAANPVFRRSTPDSRRHLLLTPSPSQSPSPLAVILNNLGFQDLANASLNANISTINFPLTIFAPTDSSLLTCPSCSLPLLLQEHSVLGLYSFHFLRNLAFGTKIETLAPTRCLTITPSRINNSSRSVFVNGVEITKPDLYNNGFIIVHGIQGYIAHLSPISCRIESMTSLSFPFIPPPTEAFAATRLMLKDVMASLRTGGYSIVALAMRVKYPELADLKSMTIFAIDDLSIFDGGNGHEYVANLGFHIVPNRLLMASELVRLPHDTELLTMDRGEKLVVTTEGGNGPLVPMRINYVKIKNLDLVYNIRIVVHGLSTPFPRIRRHQNDGTQEFQEMMMGTVQ
ncbi:fasciclin-like arabinogalactan protein 19 [Nicotiana sylvestris]|uniref:Fasciclin-like arabinogalactan protein 21 n=1 Tax=Nicotiana sylvestris TaxID=4096 RepID=A0A1U7X514_NICSY|nr:PREDICTED: fasciclin-like arabinogalactan protein 21 [Nicotiana sylvestris]